MRWSPASLAILLSCSAPAPREAPEDVGALVELLGSGDPVRREEGAHRLVLQGRTVRETLRERGAAKVLALVDEDTASMAADLARIFEGGPGGCDRRLREAYHTLRGGCLGREWRFVSDMLARQAFRLSEIYEPDERTKSVRFPARPGAFVDAAGDRHDLFFWVKSVRRAPDAPWVVREVYVGLHAEFEAPFKQLAATDRYPRGSALALFFGSPEVEKLAIAFPVLERLELTYGRIRDRASENAPAGFHVNADFAAGRDGGRGVYFTAESGLDPLEGRGGRLLWEGFRPAETLGPLTLRGSSFFGAGSIKPADD